MNRYFHQKSPFELRQIAAKLFQAVALVLIVTLVMPGTAAAEDRAVRVQVAPIYPEIARRMKIAGTVDIEATVDAEGNVSDARAVGGSRILAPAAEDAVRKWKFASGSSTAKITVHINFALSQ